jgi:hypothetical protein
VELRFSCNTCARWRKEEQNHSCNQDCKLHTSSCRGCDVAFLHGVTSCRGCDAAFLYGAIIIAVLRPRLRSSRSRPRDRSPKSRSRPWGWRGRGWVLGCPNLGHHLEAEVGEVEATWWARSPPWDRSQRGWGRKFEAWAELAGGSGDLAKILNTPGLQPTSTPSAHISVGPAPSISIDSIAAASASTRSNELGYRDSASQVQGHRWLAAAARLDGRTLLCLHAARHVPRPQGHAASPQGRSWLKFGDAVWPDWGSACAPSKRSSSSSQAPGR